MGLTLHALRGHLQEDPRFLFDGKNHSFLHFPSTSETNSLTISSHLCWFTSSFWLVTRDNSCDEQTSYGRCWSSIPVFDGWNACLVGWNDVIIIQLVLAKTIFGDLYLVEHIHSWWCAMVKLLNPTCTCWFLETNPSLMVSSMFSAPNGLEIQWFLMIFITKIVMSGDHQIQNTGWLHIPMISLFNPHKIIPVIHQPSLPSFINYYPHISDGLSPI